MNGEFCSVQNLHCIKPFEQLNLIYKQKYWHVTPNGRYVKLRYEWAIKNVSLNRSAIYTVSSPLSKLSDCSLEFFLLREIGS